MARENKRLRALAEARKEAERKHEERIEAAAAAVGKKPHEYLNDLDSKYKSRSPRSRKFAKELPPEGAPATWSWQ